MRHKHLSVETLLLPVISATVAAYLDLKQSENVAVHIRREPVVARGSVWSLRGREMLMERRQQITVRRDRKNENVQNNC